MPVPEADPAVAQVGWLTALPVPLLIALAPNWGFVVAANLLLGVNQGLAWCTCARRRAHASSAKGTT